MTYRLFYGLKGTSRRTAAERPATPFNTLRPGPSRLAPLLPPVPRVEVSIARRFRLPVLEFPPRRCHRRPRPRPLRDRTDQAHRKLARRETLEAKSKTPRGRPSKPLSVRPDPKSQFNFPAEQSRIMKTTDSFQQSYNMLAGEETVSRRIVGLASPRHLPIKNTSRPY